MTDSDGGDVLVQQDKALVLLAPGGLQGVGVVHAVATAVVDRRLESVDLNTGVEQVDRTDELVLGVEREDEPRILMDDGVQGHLHHVLIRRCQVEIGGIGLHVAPVAAHVLLPVGELQLRIVAQRKGRRRGIDNPVAILQDEGRTHLLVKAPVRLDRAGTEVVEVGVGIPTHHEGAVQRSGIRFALPLAVRRILYGRPDQQTDGAADSHVVEVRVEYLLHAARVRQFGMDQCRIPRHDQGTCAGADSASCSRAARENNVHTVSFLLAGLRHLVVGGAGTQECQHQTAKADCQCMFHVSHCVYSLFSGLLG